MQTVRETRDEESDRVSEDTREKKREVLDLRLVDLLDNGGLERLGLGGAGPSVLDLAVLADEELLEVPLDPLQAHDARLLVLEPLPQRARLVAVDVRLA